MRRIVYGRHGGPRLLQNAADSQPRPAGVLRRERDHGVDRGRPLGDPADWAVWIPPLVFHETSASADVSMHSVFVREDLAATLPQAVTAAACADLPMPRDKRLLKICEAILRDRRRAPRCRNGNGR